MSEGRLRRKSLPAIAFKPVSPTNGNKPEPDNKPKLRRRSTTDKPQHKALQNVQNTDIRNGGSVTPTRKITPPSPYSTSPQPTPRSILKNSTSSCLTVNNNNTPVVCASPRGILKQSNNGNSPSPTPDGSTMRRRHSVQIDALPTFRRELESQKKNEMTAKSVKKTLDCNSLDVGFSPRPRANSWLNCDVGIYELHEEAELPKGSDAFQMVMSDFKQQLIVQD